MGIAIGGGNPGRVPPFFDRLGDVGSSQDQGVPSCASVRNPPKPSQAQPPPSTSKGKNGIAPARRIRRALSDYHRLDGNILYPKYLRYKDPDLLKKALDEISDHLSKNLNWEVKDSPETEPARSAHREKIAADSAAVVKKNLSKYISDSIAEVRDPELKLFLADVIQHAPPEFHSSPAATASGHHPADEINPGGLLLHVRRAVVIGKALCDYFEVRQGDRDEILAALAAHDVLRGGEPWQANFAHPNHDSLGAQWLQLQNHASPFDEPERFGKLQRVIRYVSRHLGQWHKPDPILNLTLPEQIVSYADYLSTRDNLYLQV